MKRYALFCTHDYYPSGGWGDFVDTFDTVPDAVDANLLPPNIRGKRWPRADSYHVVDLTTGVIVTSG